MKFEDIKTINDIKTLKEQSEKEIKHLEEELVELEEAKRIKVVSVEEYARELESINRFREAEEAKMTELVKLENAYNNVMTNLIALHNLNELNIRDRQDKREIEEERKAREAEVEKYTALLPSALNDAIKDEITDMFKEKEILAEETKSVSVKSESLTENQIATLERQAASLIAEMKSLRDSIESTEDKKELKELKETLQEKATQLDDIFSILTTPFAEEIRKLYRDETLDEKEKLNKDGLSPEAANDFERLEKELEELREEQKELEKQRKDSIIRFKKIFNEERINQEQNGPFDIETYEKNFEYYMSLKEAEDKKLKDITKNLRRVHNKIKKLEREQKDIRKYSLEAASLEISYLEYMKIVQVLEKNGHKLLTKLYEKKGLGNVIHKRGGRTKEERKLLMEARNEIFREIIRYQEKSKELKSIEEVINILAGEELDDLKVVKKVDKPNPLKLSSQQKEALEDNLGIIINGDVYITGDVNININNGAMNPNLRNAVGRDVPEANVVEEEKKEEPVVTPQKEPITSMDETKSPEELKEEIIEQPEEPEIEEEKEEEEKQEKGIVVKQFQPPAVVPEKVEKPVQHKKPVKVEEPIVKEEPEKVEEPEKTTEPVEPIVPQKPEKTEEPENIVDKPKKAEKPQKQKESKSKRGIREIIKDIRKDYQIGKKDGQRYSRANLNVTQIFLNEMHSGNYQYNIIHIVPGIIKAAGSLIAKLSGKLMTGKRINDLMENMKKNVDALSDDDLEVLWEQFRGNFITQERYPKALVMVIQEKMHEYAMGKVEVINLQITNAYRQVFAGKTMVEALNIRINKETTSKEEKQILIAQRDKILKTIADNIDLIREKKVEGNKILSDGLHGMDEDIRAAESKMNYVGYRFAKDYDLDVELEDRLMEYEKAENKARELGDYQGVLDAFLHQEMLLDENTKISNSWHGKITSGKKQYSPLVEAQRYEQDPFIRDLFTTIAFTSAAVGAINAINVHRQAQEQVDSYVKSVQTKGQELVDKAPIYRRGMEAQANEDVLSASDALEREALDHSAIESGRWMGGHYTQYDAANHATFDSFNASTQGTLTDIANKVSSGQLTQTQALEELVKLQTQTQSTLTGILTKCYQTLSKYRQGNPQYALDAPEQTMQFLINNSNAINDMNYAMLDSVRIGEELLGESATVVSQLPNDLLTTLAACAGSALLAYKVATTMRSNMRNNYYHDSEVRDMLADEKKSKSKDNNKSSSASEPDIDDDIDYDDENAYDGVVNSNGVKRRLTGKEILEINRKRGRR